MVQIAFAIGFGFVAMGLGCLPVAWLDRRHSLSAAERLTLAFGIGCAAISLAVLGVGIIRLDRISMGTLMLACIAAALMGFAGLWRNGSISEITRNIRVSFADPLTSFLWLCLITCSVLLLVQGLAPPNDYDSLLYHLSLPKYDVEAGRMTLPWDRAIAQVGFPALGGNLSRLALTLSGEGAAQIIHGLFGLATASSVGLLTYRMNFGRNVALLAAGFFIVIRMVIWQMASVETDLLVTFYAVGALLVYSNWRTVGGYGLSVLFGILIGASIFAKYSGMAIALAFAPIILFDLLVRKRSWSEMIVGVSASAAVILPHCLRVYFETGNPVFPLFTKIFNPQMSDLNDIASELGTGRGLTDFLSAPWNMSVLPMHYFDGMMLGAPYLLAFAPLILLTHTTWRRWLLPACIAAIYYAIWFWLLSQQVRFFLPGLAIFCALAAVGWHAMWEASSGRRFVRGVFLMTTAVLALNQAMFVGIYAALRLPVSIGLMDPGTYHARTPTMTGAHYLTCTYVTENLKPGERFLSVAAAYNSYYCPQKAAVYRYFPDEGRWWITSRMPPEMSLDTFVARFEQAHFRFVIMSRGMESRRDHVGESNSYEANGNLTAQSRLIPIDPQIIRFGTYLYPVFAQLKPLSEDNLTAVYDGAQVLAGLKALQGIR